MLIFVLVQLGVGVGFLNNYDVFVEKRLLEALQEALQRPILMKAWEGLQFEVSIKEL